MVRVLIFFVLFLLAACGGSTSEKEEESNSFVLAENQDSILMPYFEIVKALQNDEFDKASELGKLLSTASTDTGVKLALTRMGALMSQSSSIYDQRAVLEQMGMVITLYIEQEIMNDYPIYKFKCKNKFDGKEVVWFSFTKKTSNPFIGENSNKCIELIETFEPIIKK